MSQNDAVVWLSAVEAARRIGVAKVTLLRLVNDGLLPAYKPARNLQFKEREVEEYIEKSRVLPGELGHLVQHRPKPSRK